MIQTLRNRPEFSLHQYLLLVLCCILTTPLLTTAQARYSCRADSLPLETVFNNLKADYDIKFSYATDAVRDEIVSVNFENAGLTELLDSLLLPVGLEYKIVDSNILVRKVNNVEYFEQPPSGLVSFLVKGKIVDEDHAPLPMATIQVGTSTIGTYTDENGFFQLEIPAEYLEGQLIVRFVGYAEARYQLSEIQDEILLLQLHSGQVAIAVVEVVNREKPVRLLTKDESLKISHYFLNQNLAGLAGADLFRQLQLLPGVYAADDVSADIKIRGSNADETLIVLDGMPLYHSSHYYGIFSGVNAGFVDHAVLYKNKMPEKYGDKTAGVVDMQSRDVIASKTTGAVGINLMTADAIWHTPVGENVQLSLAGRTTLRNISNTQFNTFAPRIVNDFMNSENGGRANNGQYAPDFTFYDMNGKLLIRPTKSNMLDINFYKSNDQLVGENSTKVRGENFGKNRLATAESETWDNLSGAINFQQSFSSKYQLEANLFYTKFENDSKLGYDLFRESRNGDLDTLFNFGNQTYNDIEGTGGHLSLKIGDENQAITIGLSATNTRLNYEFLENNRELLNNEADVTELAFFGNYEYLFKNNLQINAGLRATYFQPEKTIYFSPRISLAYPLSEAFHFKSSAGRYWQFIRQLNYDYRGTTRQFWVAANEEVPILRSDNYMLGFQYADNGWTFDVESYYKDMSGVQEFAPGNPSQQNDNQQARDYRLFTGEGYAVGLDVVVSKGFDFWDTYLSYTWSKTEYSIPEIARGDYLPSEDDRRHQLKWVNLWHYKQFDFGLDAVYASGLRYLNIDEVRLGDIRDIRNRYTRLPAYVRFDLGAAWNFNILKNDASIRLSLFNAFNHQNVKYIKSILSTAEGPAQMPLNVVIGDESNLLQRTVNLEVGWKW